MGVAFKISDLRFTENLGTVTITDTPPVVVEVGNITIHSKPATITDSVQLSVSYIPENTTQKGVVWKSSDESIATVSKGGLVSVKKDGTVTITAMSSYNSQISDSFTTTCSKTHETIDVLSVTVAGTDSGEIGGTVQLTASVLPENATDKSVTWRSNNTSIATVDDNGLVTLRGEGTVTITATSVSNTSVWGIKAISVTAAYVPVSSVLISGDVDGRVGDTIQLTASVLPENATDKSVTWTSDNEEVAAVDNGAVTLKKVGSVNITATSVSETAISNVHSIHVVEAAGDQYPVDMLLHLNASGMGNPETNWPDLSGNGNDFTLSGFAGTLDDGWGMNELVYGTDSTCKVVNSTLNDGGLSADNAVTVFVKVRLDGLLGIKKLFYPNVDSGSNYNYSLGTTADGIVATVSGKNYKLATSMPINTCFVAGLRLSGARLTIYMNETKFDIMDDVAVTRYNQVQRCALGHNLNKWGTAGERISGAIREVLVYSRALTDLEVTTVVSLMNK